MNSKQLEPKAQAALAYLHENAMLHGRARAQADHMDSFVTFELNRIKGLICGDLSDAAKTAEGMRHPDYLEALEARKTAKAIWFEIQFKREAAMAFIEAWRTCCSNERANVS